MVHEFKRGYYSPTNFILMYTSEQPITTGENKRCSMNKCTQDKRWYLWSLLGFHLPTIFPLGVIGLEISLFYMKHQIIKL